MDEIGCNEGDIRDCGRDVVVGEEGRRGRQEEREDALWSMGWQGWLGCWRRRLGNLG